MEMAGTIYDAYIGLACVVHHPVKCSLILVTLDADATGVICRFAIFLLAIFDKSFRLFVSSQSLIICGFMLGRGIAI